MIILKNCYNLIKSVYLIKHFLFKLLGLAPWALNDSKSSTVCKFSYFGTFYNISMAGGTISIALYVWRQINYTPVIKDSVMSSSTLVNLQFFMISFIGIMIIISTVQQKKMIIMLNDLNKVDNLLQKFGCNPSKNGNLIINLIFFTHLVVRFAIGFIACHEFSYIGIGMIWPSNFYTCLILQYTITLGRINKRFKMMNLSIMKLCNELEEPEIFEPSFIVIPSLPRRSLIIDVIDIKQIYNKLCQVCDNTSKFYGFTFLTAIMHNIISVMINLFFAVLAFMEKIELVVSLQFTSVVIGTVWSTIVIIVLTSYVTYIINQSKETPVIINNLISRCVVDKKVNEELLNFLDDISFRKVQFTTCNIVSLDRSLLADISGTFMCYLIILVQFHIDIPVENKH